MEENDARTVQFNVGGQLYQVARSLLEQYPSTMLYCAAAERWQTDSQATIFIEGDGERFRYCLDYMRRQHVYLPLTIPEAAVLADLDYYGFPNVDPSRVHRSCLISEVTQLQAVIEELELELKQRKEEMELKKACILFASKCFSRIVRDQSMVVDLPRTANYTTLINATSAVRFELLNNCLAAYGLYVVYWYDGASSLALGWLAEKPARWY